MLKNSTKVDYYYDANYSPPHSFSTSFYSLVKSLRSLWVVVL